MLESRFFHYNTHGYKHAQANGNHICVIFWKKLKDINDKFVPNRPIFKADSELEFLDSTYCQDNLSIGFDISDEILHLVCNIEVIKNLRMWYPHQSERFEKILIDGILKVTD